MLFYHYLSIFLFSRFPLTFLNRLWRSEDGANVGTLTGHAARIWDISSNSSGKVLASAAGDGEVRVCWSEEKAQKGKERKRRAERQIIYYLLFIIYYLLFIIYYLLFIIYYLLFIIYYLLFIYKLTLYK
jgi:hypothetical protein